MLSNIFKKPAAIAPPIDPASVQEANNTQPQSLRESLAAAEASAVQAGLRLEDALRDESDEKAAFEAAMRRYASSTNEPAPSPNDLREATHRRESLEKAFSLLSSQVADLDARLTAAEAAEREAALNQDVASRTAVAATRLAAFAACLSLVRAAEQDLFTAIFGADGLGIEFADAERQRYILGARHAARAMAVESAENSNYLLDPRFDSEAGKVYIGPGRYGFRIKPCTTPNSPK